MQYSVFHSFLILFTLISCSSDKNPPTSGSGRYEITPYEIIAEQGHTAEGGLLLVNDKDLYLFYRKDPSFSHVSNGGAIVGRKSSDFGQNWGEEFDVYNSPYDDRNLIVGQLASGEMILVFRRYDDQNQTTIDSGYLKSLDGQSWSEYRVLPGTQGVSNQPFGVFNHRPETSSFLVAFNQGLIRQYSSSTHFDGELVSRDIINDSERTLQEPVEVLLNDGKSLVLCRNGNGKQGEPSFFQYSSANGRDYQFDGPANLFEDFDYSVRCPLSITYDQDRDELLVLGNTRFLYNTPKNESNGLRIYSQKGTTAYQQPNTYELDTLLSRPMPSAHWFYGYPKGVKLNENDYLYIISDAKIHDPSVEGSHLQNEDANLYQFRLKKLR